MRDFRWLWAAYAASAYGSGFGFGALPLIAVLVLDAGPAQVSVLSAVGPAVGALIALPLGPWIELRRKRPVMIATDLTRFAVMMTIPVAFAVGRLTFGQLLVVSGVVAASKIAFTAAGGAGDLLDGWRHLLGHPGLRPLFLNHLLVAGLILATEPLLAVLLLRDLGFPPWQYGLAFAVPCVGGLVGSRLARWASMRWNRDEHALLGIAAGEHVAKPALCADADTELGRASPFRLNP